MSANKLALWLQALWMENKFCSCYPKADKTVDLESWKIWQAKLPNSFNYVNRQNKSFEQYINVINYVSIWYFLFSCDVV